ncbi:PREDICTED: glutathione S-transferase T3-like [Brassica oleracea var. oleracea]|uniref:glutathione S-transferase T3-like n=1 Tax=Brassica oleracea var. oleracea TaxID=109376 RepID=UPI0006A73BAB|nr:PREDICTED: glutathione S-transferase T3-like [Brassica oleracea var. oleracea]
MDRHPAPTTAPSVLTALLRFVVLSPPEEGSKSTTIDDSLCPDGVYSVCSCLLPQKNDLKPPQSTTLSVLIVSLPSSLVFFRQQDSVPFPYEGFSEGGDLRSSQLPVFSTQLNTSKDPVVGNEQKAGAFWKRIADYFAASPKVEISGAREAIQCKQRWQKMNDLVCKFCGAYAAATRQKTSGQSEDDVVKMAHVIFYNDHKIKFNLHHAWEELKNDQKWCALASSKIDGPQSSSAKKRKCEDGGEEASSQATTNGDHPTKRPPGGDNETMRERENETNDTDKSSHDMKSSHEVQEVTR